MSPCLRTNPNPHDGSALVLRECADADWPQVLDLLSRVYVGEGYTASGVARQSYRREKLEPCAAVITAVDGGAVLGVVTLPYPGSPLIQLARAGEAEFRMLAVDPRGRGRGIGERLVAECIRRAALPPHSARQLVLWTQPGMLAAQRLYERCGFVRMPERDTVLPAPADPSVASAPRGRWAYRRSL